MKIRALNEPDASNSTSLESSSDDERNPIQCKETSQEQFFDKYRQALVSIQELKDERAMELLKELNESLEGSNDTSNEQLLQLKYSVLKNLGNLEENNIEHYIKALEIDSTDVCLWLKTGQRSFSNRGYSFARECYEKALQINPTNWIAVDKLMDLYYILHLPLELFDLCCRTSSTHKTHRKSQIMKTEAMKMHPSLNSIVKPSKVILNTFDCQFLESLNTLKTKRREKIHESIHKFKKARLSIGLDASRTQSLGSFGSYVIKIYERYAKQGLSRNTLIDLTVNNNANLTQHVNSQSNNHSSNEPQNTSSQDIEMAIDGDLASISDNERSNNRNDPANSIDETDPSKSSSRGGANTSYLKGSSLSFAAMLFPNDLGDKRRSSRNRNNQDDIFSVKMKFDELNKLLPENLRIGAIEQAIQRKREEQQKICDEEEKAMIDESSLVETNSEPVREDIIVKELIEGISYMLQTQTPPYRNNIRLYDLLFLYLSKLSSKKQNTLPDVFMKIYRIYRRLSPLPSNAFVEIGSSNLTLEELWFTITANEISYESSECNFLCRMLEQVKVILEEPQFREFLVRVFTILGQNSDCAYLQAALESMSEETKIYASNRKIITRAYIKTLIDRTNEKLQQHNDDPDESLDLINRLAPKSENEMSDREISSLCAAIRSAKLWQRGLDILNQRNDLNSDVIIETMNICLKEGAKMDAILSSKLCRDAIMGSRPTTWTCLYRGWIGLLSEGETEDAQNMAALDKFFDLGHQALGKKGCCCVDNGEFLMLYVKHLLDSEEFEERELLGALHCLFGYPSKKPIAVSGHKSTRIPMTWEYGQIIYPYLVPGERPTYMSALRKTSITGEIEAILREIAETIPDESSAKVNLAAIERFIEEGEPLTIREIEPNEVTEDVYYYIADHNFKIKDFPKAKKFYNLDLAVNSDRFDSWASSALIRASGVDKALSNGTTTTEDFVEGPLRKLTDSAIRCFSKATSIRPDEPNATLWIEFGNLTYNLTSLASRLFTYDDFEGEVVDEDKPVSDTIRIEKRHQELFDMTMKCFQSAVSLCESQEVWLQYFMLGKIYEKVDAFKALELYHTADNHLFLEGTTYPKKVPCYNPPDLTYEAIELHYRIHSIALKCLLNKDLRWEEMNKLRDHLLSAYRSPFVTLEGVNDPKKAIEVRVSEDISLTLADIVCAVTSEAEFDELVFMCLHGMRRCLNRCDKHFKSLYRLAFYYYKIQDFKWARDILFGSELKTDSRIRNLMSLKPGLPGYKAAPPDLHDVDPLFKNRRSNNLYFNIWRIPIDEVDRPGNFEHWMFKCTRLLMKSCIRARDTDSLATIATLLSRTPETAKKYVHDRPRILLGHYAIKGISQVIKSGIERAETLEQQVQLIKDGYALADRLIKASVFVDKVRRFQNHLNESK